MIQELVIRSFFGLSCRQWRGNRARFWSNLKSYDIVERTNNERNGDIEDILRKLSIKKESSTTSGGGSFSGNRRINIQFATRWTRRLLFLRVINRFIYCFLFLFFSFPSSVCVVVVSDLSLFLSYCCLCALLSSHSHINLCCCWWCCCCCSLSPADYRRCAAAWCWCGDLLDFFSLRVLWLCMTLFSFSWYAHI